MKTIVTQAKKKPLPLSLTKSIIVDNLHIKIRALNFGDLQVLFLDQKNPMKFSKHVLERGIISDLDINSLPVTTVIKIVQEIMSFSGLGPNNPFNPSIRNQTP